MTPTPTHNKSSVGTSPTEQSPTQPRPTVHLRSTAKTDGAALWAMARDSGALDLNSPYAYLMMAHWFAETCLIAEQETADGGRQPVGFVAGFSPPDQPDTLFVWQVAVEASQRGQGLAGRMIRHMAEASPRLTHIEATVTPSNGPSNALFQGLAKHYGAPISTHEIFSADAFPGPAMGVSAPHEGEVLYRIGPIAAVA